METPTLQTELHHKPFVISGDEASLQDIAEAIRAAQRREHAKYIMKHVVTAPARATMVLARGIGSAIAHNVSEAYEDWTLHTYDQNNGTDLYERKQRKLKEARTQALVQRIGL